MNSLDENTMARLTGIPPKHIADRVSRTIDSCIAKLQANLGLTVSRPEVTYTLVGEVAGQAWGGELIRLNMDLLLGPHQEEMLNQTIPHEMAHIAVSQRYPQTRESHGPRWRWVMTQGLHLKPTRCHNYEVKPARVVKREHVYYCKCKTHHVTAILHNRIQKGQVYTCNTCGGQLHR